jgi:hypothetical protein
MNTRNEGTIAIIAALLVLLSAMWDPQISIVIAIVCLASLGIYQLIQNKMNR